MRILRIMRIINTHTKCVLNLGLNILNCQITLPKLPTLPKMLMALKIGFKNIIYNFLLILR